MASAYAPTCSTAHRFAERADFVSTGSYMAMPRASRTTAPASSRATTRKSANPTKSCNGL